MNPNRSCCDYRKVATVVVLVILVAATVLSQASSVNMAAEQASAVTGKRRALMVQSSVILDDLPMPTYDQLHSIGVTELGTNVYADFKPEWWNKLKSWDAEVNSRGFQTFAFINDAVHMRELVSASIGSGFESIELDELVSGGLLDRASLLTTIAFARELNPKVGVIITEYDEKTLTQVMDWTNGIPEVRIAVSDYMNLDASVSFAERAPKNTHVGAWIIFIPDENYDWNCYERLDVWVGRIKALNADPMLWTIDAKGTWAENWSTLVALLSS